MTTPAWWSDGLRVTDGSLAGELRLTSAGWFVKLDGEDSAFLPDPDESWRCEVIQGVTSAQKRRIAYDVERALLRAFGCHYVPAFEELPDSMRASSDKLRPRAVNRPELDGIRALVRAAVESAMSPHVRDY